MRPGARAALPGRTRDCPARTSMLPSAVSTLLNSGRKGKLRSIGHSHQYSGFELGLFDCEEERAAAVFQMTVKTAAIIIFLNIGPGIREHFPSVRLKSHKRGTPSTTG